MVRNKTKWVNTIDVEGYRVHMASFTPKVGTFPPKFITNLNVVKIKYNCILEMKSILDDCDTV